jgi:glycosyltransferase involved in cell wall biosynthesis
MIRYTVEVLRALEGRPDIDVHVHCRPETVPFLHRELGIDGRRLHPGATGSTIRDSLTERVGLAGLIERERPEVVLGTKQLIPRRVGDELRVLTVHDLLPFDRPGDFGSAKRLLLPPVYRRSLREADVLACVSEATRDRLVHHEPAVAGRAVVIPNALSSTLTATPAAPIDPLEDRVFALVVGDRSHRKNLGFVAGLWPEVVARHPGAHLALVGPPGWGRDQALPGLEELVARGSASALGLVPDAQLRWAYERAAVTLCPSLLEGFGLPVLEALSLGCPVVLSTDPAQVEVAAGRGVAIPVEDPDGWVEAIVDRLRSPRPRVAPLPVRDWDDVANDLVVTVDEARLRRVDRPALGRRRPA